MSELEQINRKILRCRKCLSSSRGKLVPGEGSAYAKIALIGEAPGKTEAETGRPFVGRAGKLLEQMLESIGLNREEVFITSAVKYLPKSYITPKSADVEHGRIHLNEQLSAIQPQYVVLLGAVAATSLLHKKVAMSEDHGTVITKDGINYFLCYHPAAPLHNPNLRKVLREDFRLLGKKLQNKTPKRQPKIRGN